MRILLLANIRGWAGDAIRIWRVHEKLRELGADVTMVNPHKIARSPRELLGSPHMLARLAWSGLLNRHLGRMHLHARFNALVIEKKIRELKPDVVWCESTYGEVADVCHRRGVPLVSDIHGLAYPEYQENSFIEHVPAIGEYIRTLELNVFEKSAILITVSQPMSDYLVELGTDREKIFCAPNGAEVQPKLAAYETPLKAIYAGVFSFWEDVDSFLDCSRSAGAHRFRLAGSGPLQQHLLGRLERERLPIDYLGHLPHARMLEVLATMQVGMVPSLDSVTRRVACPVKVLDYLSCGLPIITPGHGEWGKIIETHRCGIVTGASNGDEFAAALDRLSNREQWEEMAGNAVALIRDEMNWDRTLEPLAEILQKL